MKILYIARHGTGAADDEGAITHALTELGHTVRAVDEVNHGVTHDETAEFDFMLFNKWNNASAVAQAQCPRVFWYFDLVHSPDPSMRVTTQRRREWMRLMMPLVTAGFCTDGDFVATRPDGADNLFWLPQGMDERIMPDAVSDQPPTRQILFTGNGRMSGARRYQFVLMMQSHFDSAFTWIERGCFREALRAAVADHKIVLCPDSPTGPAYWSNRVYNALGLGGFVVHPYCRELARQYRDGEEIIFYRDRAGLIEILEHWLQRPHEDRQAVAARGLAATRARHTYRQRCQALITTVTERLKGKHHEIG